VPTVSELIPPPEALPAYARKSNFRFVGARFRSTAIDHGLKPEHRVLDLGCGVGRFAVALSTYLDEGGSYVGIDASQEAIEICNQWIGSKLDRFTFEHAQVFNAHYNRKAKVRAAEYRLPFDSESFDFVFSNSLFTHLLPRDAENYLLEISRVLKPSGRTLNTMLLLNDASLALVGDGRSRHGVLHEFEPVARVKRVDRPEAWIAFDEGFVRELHERAGLRIAALRYGRWSGRKQSGPGFGAKDIVVAVN
jgi:SAM-dependent methyltransferase